MNNIEHMIILSVVFFAGCLLTVIALVIVELYQYDVEAAQETEITIKYSNYEQIDSSERTLTK